MDREIVCQRGNQCQLHRQYDAGDVERIAALREKPIEGSRFSNSTNMSVEPVFGTNSLKSAAELEHVP